MRVYSLEARGFGLGLRVELRACQTQECLGFRGLGFRVSGLGFGVQSPGSSTCRRATGTICLTKIPLRVGIGDPKP